MSDLHLTQDCKAGQRKKQAVIIRETAGSQVKTILSDLEAM